MSPEKALYEYLKNAAETAQVGSVLDNVEVLPTVYHRPEALIAVRIGNCESTLSPGSQTMTEQDALVAIEIVVKVADEIEPEEFVAAREHARDVQLAVAGLIVDDSSLGGRVCDSLLLDAVRAWGSVKTTKNAVALLPVLVNPTGRFSN